MAAEGGGTREWRSPSLPRCARMTRQVEALIAGAYLSGTNTRRVKRALAALFGGAVGKDVVSRTWRKVRTDWDAWNRRDLAGEDIVRLILDGTVVRVRLDRKATSISLLVVLGVRRDGQKVLLAVKNMGGESEAAWRSILDDLIARGLRTPDFLITDGAAGLERALAALVRAAKRHGGVEPRLVVSGASIALAPVPESAAPIVLGHPVDHPETIATAIRIGNPASWKQAEEARDQSGGRIEAVTDEQILAAHRLLSAREGIFVEPGSAASVAGLLQAAAAGQVPTGATIVCTVTGHGLKDPQWALRNADGSDVTPTRVQVDAFTAAQALGLQD